MPSLTISPRFFKQERNNYGSWAVSFARELVQNSVDAGARKIDITVAQNGSKAYVIFEDDGCGMSEEVLRNVYFCLGETTKNDNSTIGGFGKARILTCFSHEKYNIRSMNWTCDGSGSSYEINASGEYRKGVRVEVDVDATDSYNRPVDMLRALQEYLHQSQLSPLVTVNGQRWTEWLYRRQLTRTLSFGNVYVNKSGRSNLLLVRVSGALMFARCCSCPAQVIVEIDPAKSREVLVSNRDSLKSQFNYELDQFIQELAVDNRSALKDRTRRETIRINGSPLINRRQKKVSPDRKVITAANIADFVAISPEIAHAKPSQAAQDFMVSLENEIIDEMIPSAVIDIDTENPKIKKVIDRYDPRNWVRKWQECTGRYYRFGGNVKKLLKLWIVAVRAALDEYMELADITEVTWVPGWIFSDDAGACCKTLNDGVTAFLLNPVDEDGKIKFSLRSKEDWAVMLASACHEVAHLAESNHNETFSAIFTKLVGKTFGKVKEINRSMSNMLVSED